MEVLVAHRVRRLAVPDKAGEGQRHAQPLRLGADLIADVDAVGELAAENGEPPARHVGLDGVLARELGPVARAVAGAGDDQRPDSAALGDDVAIAQRARQPKALVDVVEHEAPIVGRDHDFGAFHARVGRADAGLRLHGNDEEEAAVVGEEGQHPAVRGQSVDDDVDAFREHMVVRRGDAVPGVHLVGVWPAGVDQHRGGDGQVTAADHVARPRHPAVAAAAGPQRLDVVRGDAPAVERGADESPDEAGVVVVQIGVGILEPTGKAAGVDHGLVPFDVRGREKAGGAGKEPSDRPVEESAEPELEAAVPEAARDGGEEADLLDRARIGADEAVAGAAELADEPELVRLQVLDPAPGEIRGLLRRHGREIAALDQRHFCSTRRQRRGRYGAVDAAADDEDVEPLFAELVHVGLAERGRGLAHAAKIHRPTRSQSRRNRASSKPDPERRNVAPADS